jgi:N-acetylneuraminic acid mutarotase
MKTNKPVKAFGLTPNELIDVLKHGGALYFDLDIADKKIFKSQIMRIHKSEKKQSNPFGITYVYKLYVFLLSTWISKGKPEMELAFDVYMTLNRYILSIGGEDHGGKARAIFNGVSSEINK